MKVLMSAFACCPGEGSEQGVGWNWALEAGKLGHDVTVLTQRAKAPEITRAQAQGAMSENVDFDFFMPSWLQQLYDLGLKTGFHGITRQIVHLLWQIAAYFHARDHHRSRGYDVIHHITYGGIRHPTLLGHLGIPLVLGPVGGGERAPMALRKSFRWSGWLTDLARDIHTYALRFDPITRSACRQALAIYVITRESKQALPKTCHHKTSVEIEIGLRKVRAPAPKERAAGEPLRLIYAGRMLYWKGMGLGLRALAQARANGIDVRLTMIGSGPEEQTWRAKAEDLGIADAVDWLGWVPHSELTRHYREHDVLLFPSLHDSSGNVVLEAFALGLPVICLALGGPAEMVTPQSGRAIEAYGRNEAACVDGLARAMSELSGSNELLRNLRLGALARAANFGWRDLVGRVYRDIEHRLAEQPDPLRETSTAALEAEGVRR